MNNLFIIVRDIYKDSEWPAMNIKDKLGKLVKQVDNLWHVVIKVLGFKQND